jgi:hypothetical protein
LFVRREFSRIRRMYVLPGDSASFRLDTATIEMI